MAKSKALFSLLILPAVIVADSCISLSGSTTCPAFNRSSISTDDTLVGLYPFLSSVSSREEFDTELSNYVKGQYVETKYVDLLGCDNIDLANTTDLYARYTISVLCNGIVQNSIDACDLTGTAARPLCADTCALEATSEEYIVINTAFCKNANSSQYMSQIRADFTNCALPADSLTGTCISGSDNEPENCGFSTNLVGLCGYCGDSTVNATDSCCVNSKAETRCANVTLPTATSTLPPIVMTTTAAANATAGNGSSSESQGLSGGAIAGIVIGAIVAAAILAALAFWCFLLWRRRREEKRRMALNQPTPPRQGPPSMTYRPASSSHGGFEPVPGARVARMSALQGSTSSSDSPRALAAAIGSRKYDTSESEGYSSPTTRAGGPPRRHGSLSSGSALGGEAGFSPSSGTGGTMSSPDGVASGQSEQLPYFKDYYSNDEIHPGDKVSVLWTYQPRAGDEFDLAPGDMLKVVGIWDDGWATGVRISDRADLYDGKEKVQRDSGVSQGNNRSSSPLNGEIKAFPLVCVCLPEHWNKAREGEDPNDSDSNDFGSPRRS